MNISFHIACNLTCCPVSSVHHTHCKENLDYVFLFWELRGLSPNFHIHVSVSNLYIPKVGPHTVYPCGRIDRPILKIYKSPTDI
jgi:hypothetical protein